MKRFYLASPSFSWAVADFVKTGRLAENFVISLKDYKFFWRDAYKHEVDFVEIKNNEIIPIEVKYKNKLSKDDFRNLVLFSKKFNAKKAVLFGKRLEKKSAEIDSLKISQEPIYFIR